ncbi:MAG: tetratricopeptide repeat protein [Candidatus Hodarchaeota archaeon]
MSQVIEDESGKEPRFKEGDILYAETDNEYNVYKILKLEYINDEFFCYHVLSYRPIKDMIGIEDVEKLDVFVMHSPIATMEGCQLLGNIPVEEGELYGYYTYLKMTDFPRYAEETGQVIEEIVEESLKYFNAGNAFCKEERFEKAIVEFSKAIDLLPHFHEAIDNRGLTYMDLGDLDNAIRDFDLSLSYKPDNTIAIFSIGECFFKMGMLEEAERQFEDVLEIDPDDALAMEWLDKTKEEIAKRDKTA